jgi:peptidoglycan/xylan/chitin deacetylase (PgdA/CDA1 family)
MAEIALKVDVDTLRGTREGVPRLLKLLAEHGARATFYFSLGPDHTGWALRRVFRRGFMAKAVRTSVVSHYGLRTLMYGVLLPGPDIARRASGPMRAVAAAGHETGIHCYDHVYWQDNVAGRDQAWTYRQLDRAASAYTRVFGSPAHTHAAAGWQVNRHLFARQDEWGLLHASDTRGRGPYLPVMDGYRAHCPQLPTTLPTLDELIGRDGRDESAAVKELLAATGADCAPQVYTLHAELEGQRLAPLFASLLSTWRERGHRLVTLAELRSELEPDRLPCHHVVYGTLPGRSGVLALQGQPA